MEKDIELNSIMETLDLARQIHLYKTSPDAMERIFYDQPVLVSNARSPGTRGKDGEYKDGFGPQEVRDIQPISNMCTLYIAHTYGLWRPSVCVWGSQVQV